jgi:hypothetical protein
MSPQAAQSLSGLYILNIYTEYLTVIIFNNEIIQRLNIPHKYSKYIDHSDIGSPVMSHA